MDGFSSGYIKRQQSYLNTEFKKFMILVICKSIKIDKTILQKQVTFTN